MSNINGGVTLKTDTMFGVELGISKKGYGVYARLKEEKAGLKWTYIIHVKTPEGNFYYVNAFQYNSNRDYDCLEFLLGVAGGFEVEDLENMWNVLKEATPVLQENLVVLDNIPPAQEVPKRVIQYIRENNEKPYGEDGVSILISKGYGYIRSTYIDEMIKDLGWKCTKDELQDNLLMAGIFEFSKSKSEDEKKKRPSHVKRMPSKGFRCWKIRLS